MQTVHLNISLVSHRPFSRELYHAQAWDVVFAKKIAEIAEGEKTYTNSLLYIHKCDVRMPMLTKSRFLLIQVRFDVSLLRF